MADLWVIQWTMPHSHTKHWLIWSKADEEHFWSELPALDALCTWDTKEEADIWLVGELLSGYIESDAPLETVPWTSGTVLGLPP